MRRPAWIAVFAVLVACSAAEEPSTGRFAPLGTDVVSDAASGLTWTARDTGRELSWTAADQLCRGLALGEGDTAWRMPSIKELAALYDASVEQHCGENVVCRLDPAIQLSSPYQWSDTAPHPDRRFYFDFTHGTQLSPLIRPTLTRRALCTRGE